MESFAIWIMKLCFVRNVLMTFKTPENTVLNWFVAWAYVNKWLLTCVLYSPASYKIMGQDLKKKKKEFVPISFLFWPVLIF